MRLPIDYTRHAKQASAHVHSASFHANAAMIAAGIAMIFATISVVGVVVKLGQNGHHVGAVQLLLVAIAAIVAGLFWPIKDR